MSKLTFSYPKISPTNKVSPSETDIVRSYLQEIGRIPLLTQEYDHGLKFTKSYRRQYRATWKKLIIYIGLFLVLVVFTMAIMLML